MTFYALEIYPDKPMQQVSGMLHPAGKVHAFEQKAQLDAFIAAHEHSRLISHIIADVLKNLTPGGY